MAGMTYRRFMEVLTAAVLQAVQRVKQAMDQRLSNMGEEMEALRRDHESLRSDVDQRAAQQQSRAVETIPVDVRVLDVEEVQEALGSLRARLVEIQQEHAQALEAVAHERAEKQAQNVAEWREALQNVQSAVTQVREQSVTPEAHAEALAKITHLAQQIQGALSQYTALSDGMRAAEVSVASRIAASTEQYAQLQERLDAVLLDVQTLRGTVVLKDEYTLGVQQVRALEEQCTELRSSVAQSLHAMETRLAEAGAQRVAVQEAIAAVVREVTQAEDALVARCTEALTMRVGETVDERAETFTAALGEVRALLERIPSAEQLLETMRSAIPAPVDEAALVRQILAGLPPPVPGRDGEAPTVEALQALVKSAVAQLPPPPTLEDVLGRVLMHIDGKLSEWELAFERRAQDVLTRAAERIPVPAPGRDGRDAFSLEDFSISMLEDQRTLRLRFAHGELVREKDIVLNVPIYRGVYRDTSSYQRADCVTHGGSVFMAQCATRAVPGTNDDWVLSVKRGRDGKPGSRGEKGDKGDPGVTNPFDPLNPSAR